MQEEEIKKLKEAGKIAKQAVNYAREIIKPGMPLLEIAEKIEDKILELGGKPAFPVNLSIDEVAAHSTPSWNDTKNARGLLKVDIGVHIEGYIADNAFSLDLENSEENKKLIEAAEKALEKALEKLDLEVNLREVGKVIEKAISIRSLQAIRNLSGHSIERYNLHSGITLPNYDNSKNLELKPGLYAIEPFATSGLGSVRDGKPSEIYVVQKTGNVRDEFSREVLKFILEEYKTLPFCSRWIHKRFGSRGLLALKRIEEAGILHNYAQLIERGVGKVAQAEHTVLLTIKEKCVTTL
ncbi:MAG: type II methionyl aminopeptidase [Nanoarchaeota archaeon]|nr:type II methionyl aminopeptidase [Nanoarchaeota archaeon]